MVNNIWEKLNSLIQPMVYMYYWLQCFNNNNLKYLLTSQRRSFNSLSLVYFFFSHCFFLLSLFNTSCAKKHHIFNISLIYIHLIELKFLLCDVLHSVENMYWWTFREDCFYCYFQQIISAVTNESLVPYKLIIIEH